MARLSDGRPLSERQTSTYSSLLGPSQSFDVSFFDNAFDNYVVVVSPAGYRDSGWYPVLVHPSVPGTVALMALPNDGELHFPNATGNRLQAERPGVAINIRLGTENEVTAATAYGTVLENRPKSLACFLNIVTAMAQIRLPSGKTPLDYYWNIAWPENLSSPDWLARLDSVFQQDRFFCYADASILPDIRAAAKNGSFAPEPNPGALHPGATESYKQTQFNVSNVQLTFHGHDTAVLHRADGTAVNCVKVEPDIDYYKDLVESWATGSLA